MACVVGNKSKDIGMGIRKSIVVSFLPCLDAPALKTTQPPPRRARPPAPRPPRTTRPRRAPPPPRPRLLLPRQGPRAPLRVSRKEEGKRGQRREKGKRWPKCKSISLKTVSCNSNIVFFIQISSSKVTIINNYY